MISCFNNLLYIMSMYSFNKLCICTCCFCRTVRILYVLLMVLLFVFWITSLHTEITTSFQSPLSVHVASFSLSQQPLQLVDGITLCSLMTCCIQNKCFPSVNHLPYMLLYPDQLLLIPCWNYLPF